MLGGRSRSGIELVLDAIRFSSTLECTALCLTGEGRLDGQSVQGKACFGVARAAQAAEVPVIGFFGQISVDAPGAARCAELGMGTRHVIAPGVDEVEAMRDAAALLERSVSRVLSLRL